MFRHPKHLHVSPNDRRFGLWGRTVRLVNGPDISAAGAQGNASGSASGRGARRRPEGDAKLIDNGSWKGGGGGRKSHGSVDGFCIICGSIPLSKR